MVRAKSTVDGVGILVEAITLVKDRVLVASRLLFTIGVSLILFHGGTGISLRVLSRSAVGLGPLVARA
jgi:NhaP-type Na+/H+ or K+/H+ antiporter